MTRGEYFGGWCRYIDFAQIDRLVSTLRGCYGRTTCYPDWKNIFRAFNMTPEDKVCCVMIGMDPYNDGSATGIAFANRKGQQNLSPSLNVLKEAVLNLENPGNMRIFDVTLESWASQGILLLNSALTVEKGKAGSHSGLWFSFMKDFLTKFSMANPGIIYVLWGQNAKSFEKYIHNGIIIKEKHPASYARSKQKLSYAFFPNLKNQIKRHFDKDVYFYKEVMTDES